MMELTSEYIVSDMQPIIAGIDAHLLRLQKNGMIDHIHLG